MHADLGGETDNILKLKTKYKKILLYILKENETTEGGIYPINPLPSRRLTVPETIDGEFYRKMRFMNSQKYNKILYVNIYE